MSATLETIRRSSDATLSRVVVSEVLGVNPRTVTEGIKQGNIPAIKVGRRVLIPREKFLALFETEVA